MSTPLADVRSVVKSLGGARDVANLFGCTENAVWNWGAANRFPADTYVVLQAELKARKITASENLWPMAKPGRPRRVRPSQRAAV